LRGSSPSWGLACSSARRSSADRCASMGAVDLRKFLLDQRIGLAALFRSPPAARRWRPSSASNAAIISPASSRRAPRLAGGFNLRFDFHQCVLVGLGEGAGVDASDVRGHPIQEITARTAARWCAAPRSRRSPSSRIWRPWPALSRAAGRRPRCSSRVSAATCSMSSAARPEKSIFMCSFPLLRA